MKFDLPTHRFINKTSFIHQGFPQTPLMNTLFQTRSIPRSSKINHPLFKIRAPPFYMYSFQTLLNPKWQDDWLEVLADFIAQSYYSANKPSNPYKHFRRNSVVLHTRQAQVSNPSNRYFTDTIKSSKNTATVPLDSVPEENPETTWHLWVMAYVKPVRSTVNSLQKELIKFLERDFSASVSI